MKPLSNCVFIGKSAPRQRFTDHDGWRSLRCIALVEHASAPEGDSRHFEISRAHNIAKGAVASFGFTALRRLEARAVFVKFAAQRQLTGESGFQHAGSPPHSFERICEEASYCADIESGRCLNLHR